MNRLFLILLSFITLSGTLSANEMAFPEVQNWQEVDLLAAPGSEVSIRLPDTARVTDAEARQDYNWMRVYAFQYLAGEADNLNALLDVESLFEVKVYDYRHYHTEAFKGNLPPLYKVLEDAQADTSTFPRELYFRGFPAAEYVDLDHFGDPKRLGLVFLVEGVVYQVEWRLEEINRDFESLSIVSIFAHWEQVKQGISISAEQPDRAFLPMGWAFDESEFADAEHRRWIVKRINGPRMGPYVHEDGWEVTTDHWEMPMHKVSQEYYMVREEKGLPRYLTRYVRGSESGRDYLYTESRRVGGVAASDEQLRSGDILAHFTGEGETVESALYSEVKEIPIVYSESSLPKEMRKRSAIVMVDDTLYSMSLIYPEGSETELGPDGLTVDQKWNQLRNSFELKLYPLEVKESLSQR